MRKLIFFLLVLLAATWIGIKIAADPGYFLVAWQHWTMEMPLWLAAVLLFISLFVFHFLLNAIRATRLLPRHIRNWSAKRRVEKSDELTHQGLVALSKGHWSKAEKQLTKAAQRSNRSWVHHLYLALSAHHQQKYSQQEVALNKAISSTPESEIAVGILKGQFQINQKQYPQAMLTLERLHKLAPGQSYILRLLASLYIQLKEWKKLLAITPQLRKCSDVSSAEIDGMEITAYENILANDQTNLSKLNADWQSVPKNLKTDARLISVYAKSLNDLKASDQAETIIQKNLAKNWNQQLAYDYGLIYSSYPEKQLRTAESWLPAHKEDPQLLLTLGKLSFRNQLWGKARSYLESSILFKPTSEANFELGKLFETLGEDKKAFTCYHSALREFH